MMEVSSSVYNRATKATAEVEIWGQLKEPRFAESVITIFTAHGLYLGDATITAIVATCRSEIHISHLYFHSYKRCLGA